MLRVLPTYIICASAVSAMLTLFAISTHIGSWLARITLFFLPEHPQISAENAGSPAMLYGIRYAVCPLFMGSGRRLPVQKRVRDTQKTDRNRKIVLTSFQGASYK